MNRAFCFLLFFWWSTIAVFAQENAIASYLYEPLGVDQGLTATELYCVYQDKFGQIWVGTNIGVSTYDGYTFQNFIQTAQGDPIGLVNDFIEDHQGTLWVGGKNGLFFFSGGTFHKVDIPDPIISDFEKDHQGNIWVAGNGFIPFLLEKKELALLKLGQSVPLHPVMDTSSWQQAMKELQAWKIAIDSTGNIYFGNDTCLSYFDGQDLHTIFQFPKRARFKLIAPITPDSVYLGGEYFSFSLIKKGQRIELDDWLQNGSHVSLDAIYFQGGHQIFQFKDNEIRSLFSLEDFNCDDFWGQGLLRDNEGCFWLPTFDGALLKFTPSFFEVYLREDYPALSTNYSLEELSDGSLIIGRHRGRVLKKGRSSFEYFLPPPPKGIHFGGVRDIHENEDGSLWLATEIGGLLHYKDGQYQLFRKEDGLADNNHFFIKASSPEILWTGNNRFITKIIQHKDSIAFKAISCKDSNTDPRSSEIKMLANFPTFKAMLIDDQKRHWFASNMGLFYLAKDSLAQWFFQDTPDAPPNILDLVQDHSNFIWLATMGDGVWQCQFDANRELQVIKKWTVTDGLISNTFLDLHLDKKGRLWMVSPVGICYFEDGQPLCFTKSDGWMNIISQDLKMMESQDSLLWIVGYNGLANFPLYDFKVNAKTPTAILQKVDLFGGKESILAYAKGIDEKTGLPQAVSLPYNKNMLGFHFSSSSQIHPEKNRFRYLMDGAEGEWTLLNTGQNEVSFPKLPPGRYNFRLQASNNDGVWSKDASNFTFTILKPWWRSTLAYLGYLGFIITALFFARRQIINREKLRSQLKLEQVEKEKVKEIDQVRARFFANISHEFRTPLTLIKAPLEDLLTSRKYDVLNKAFSQMHRNTERLLSLVNQLLELSRLEAGALQLNNQPYAVFTLLRQLAGNFQSLADQKQIDFRVEIPEENKVLLFDKDKLEKVVLNLLSNALKFTPQNGWVCVRASWAGRLLLEVGNNGSSIPKEEQARIFDRFYQAGDTRHQGTGIGLALSKEFVDLYKGEISVQSDEENGTWFRVELNLETSNLGEELRINKSTPPSMLSKNNIEEDKKVIPIQEESDHPLLLLVEDHEEVRQYISSKLRPHYQVLEAENGAVGFEKAVAQLPEIIISDLMMPEMDGMTLCDKIKSDHRTDHIPFILLTAKADMDSRLEGLKTGADEYLAKPFNSQELLTRSHNLVVQRKKLQERYKQKIEVLPSEIEISSSEQKFIQKAIEVVEAALDDASFSVDDFAQQMLLSRVHLHRKLKVITGMSASAFVRNLRLERAAQLLKGQSDTVSQIAFEVGFNNLSYFAKCFKEKYNCAPSDYK